MAAAARQSLLFAWRRAGAPLRSSAALFGGAGRFVLLEPAREPTGVVSMASGLSGLSKACGKEAIIPMTLGRHLQRREIHSSRRVCSEDKDEDKDKDRKRLPSDDPSQVRVQGLSRDGTVASYGMPCSCAEASACQRARTPTEALCHAHPRQLPQYFFTKKQASGRTSLNPIAGFFVRANVYALTKLSEGNFDEADFLLGARQAFEVCDVLHNVLQGAVLFCSSCDLPLLLLSFYI